jgi:uncharacterized protein YoxC
MKTIEEELGKVSLTCNGQWNDRPYERLCIVHDGFYASYISRKAVPAGIPLSNEEYWQPIAKLREDLVIDYETFKKEILELIAVVQRGLKAVRIVVSTMEDRDALTWEQIGVGCEVYVIETKKSYILDEITPVTNAKKWHLEADSEIGSKFVESFSGMFPRAIAERAVADEFGINIQDNYLRRNIVVNYMAQVLKQYFEDNAVQILEGQITPEMLSESVKQMFTASQITNAADEEDLTVVDNLLKFADKDYNVNNYSGKARKYLRKNMISGVNTLTQDMINEPNTIYILQYDYCLAGETITLPYNSIILWRGGRLYDGAIKLNQCRLLSNYRQEDMFDKESISLDGDWAKGQILYHPLDLGEDNKQVEITGWGGTYTNDFYWFWDEEKWVSMGFDLSVYFTRAEFEAFLEKLREEMEKFYAWLLEELRKINARLDEHDRKITSIEGDIANINSNIDNLRNEMNNKFGDINNIINDLSSSIGDRISNLESYINNKIKDILNNINSSGNTITNEYKQYFKSNYVSMFKNKIKPGTNITFVENSDGTITINASGGGGGGGGLTEQEVRDIVNSMLNNYYTKQEINDIIAGLGGGGSGTMDEHNVMSTTQLGEARTGKYLVMNKFADSEAKPSKLDVDFNTLYTDIKNRLVIDGFGQGGGTGGGGGLDASTVQSWIAAVMPIGSIMLWDTSTPPNGWEVYTAAQGRFVMGYIPNGINIYNNPKQGNLDWKTVLENIKDTYDPAAPGRNVSAYGFYIGGTDLPLHQHAVAVGKTKSGDNNHQVIAPSNWRFISGNLDGDVKNGYPYGTDRNRLDNLGINRSTNWYMTGPNISNNGEMTWQQISGNRWTGDYLAINKLMPTIALHYIKRVSNPW